MRQFLFGMLLLLAASGQSAASSFVVLPAEPPAEARSVIFLGEPVASPVEARPLPAAASAAEAFLLSPSVIAFGAEAIPAAQEQVASIRDRPEDRRASDRKTKEKPRWNADSMPLVIRGGIAGDAFSTTAASAAAAQDEASAPAQKPQPGRAPARPEPAAPPPAPAAAPQFRAPR